MNIQSLLKSIFNFSCGHFEIFWSNSCYRSLILYFLYFHAHILFDHLGCRSFSSCTVQFTISIVLLKRNLSPQVPIIEFSNSYLVRVRRNFALTLEYQICSYMGCNFGFRYQELHCTKKHCFCTKLYHTGSWRNHLCSHMSHSHGSHACLSHIHQCLCNWIHLHWTLSYRNSCRIHRCEFKWHAYDMGLQRHIHLYLNNINHFSTIKSMQVAFSWQGFDTVHSSISE